MIADCEAEEQQGQLYSGGKRLPQGPKVSLSHSGHCN